MEHHQTWNLTLQGLPSGLLVTPAGQDWRPVQTCSVEGKHPPPCWYLGPIEVCTVGKRAVHILLECFLVENWFRIEKKCESSLNTREGNVFRRLCKSFCLQGWVWYRVPSRGYDNTSCLVPCSLGGLLPWRGRKGYPLVLTSSGDHCSGRYASYWNAFMLSSCSYRFML